MSNQTKNFMSKDNIKVIIGIFSTYMEESHSVKVETMDLKKMIFSLMNTVTELTPPGAKSIHQMNLEVLTMAKAHYIKNQKSKPNVLNLSRDTDVFGKRQVSFNELIPAGNPYQRKAGTTDENSPLDKLIEEREGSSYKKVIPDITKLGRQITEKPENTDDFLKKLKQLEDERVEQERNAVDREFRETHTIDMVDPKAMFEQQQQMPRLPTVSMDDVLVTRQDFLIPDIAKSGGMGGGVGAGGGMGGGGGGGGGMGGSGSMSGGKVVIQKYLSINSMDREWDRNTFRYNYSVTFNGSGGGFNGNYKNIRSIEVGKVVIPEEIMEYKNILNYPNKTTFNHEFSFSYPYLILRIDEFNDVYDGTNEDIRKSFCKLAYHKSYKAPNGRGYVILKPFQKEKKYFYPTPLSNLSRFTLSILKPNGFLLNDSADSYKVHKVYYSPFNPHFYEVVTDVFFDKNEFFVGDVVKFKDFDITSNGGNASKTVSDFLNRAEGHEIMQIGATNENGYYRSFLIMAIGQFNKQEGKFDTDMPAVTSLNSYNDTIDYTTFTGFNGYILNTSLQNTIGMSLDVLVNDVSGVM